MKIKKRDGREVQFDKSKIEEAILSAFKAVDGELSDYSKEKAKSIANYVEKQAQQTKLDVENIQDLVENGLMATKRKDVAREYVTYRHERTLARGNTIDDVLEELLSGNSEYWNTENSNKNSTVVTTQRDYIAGIVSTDMTMRKLLPKDLVEAHREGIVHFHKYIVA